MEAMRQDYKHVEATNMNVLYISSNLVEATKHEHVVKSMRQGRLRLRHEYVVQA